MARKKKVIEVDYGKSGKETLIEMGLLSTNEDPGRNIVMPVRRTKEEYENNNPFKKEYIPLTAREEHECSVILAQKMLKQFRWLPWMKPFIDNFGNPKIYTRKKSTRKKIDIDEVPEVKTRQKIEL
uniref:Uncharacterized protein n=1 Tax=viral metagenome TaxID=1070528 RepID=A0A6M3JNG9_9ZZZZ